MARLAQIAKRTSIGVMIALATALCMIAAPAMAAGRDQGLLEIRIKDHREAIGDFAQFDINIDKISVSPKPGMMFWQTGWKDLTPSRATVDLTRHIGTNTARVFHAAVAAGAFDAFHLKLKSINAVLKKNRRAASVKNSLGPVKLSFEVPSQGETLLILDLVVSDFSDHPPRGYELAFNGYELYVNGKLIEKIPPG